MKNINIVIPAAGDGRRFKEAGYDLPKPLIKVNGKPMIKAVVDSIVLPNGYIPNFIFVIREYENRNHNVRLNCLLESFNARVVVTPVLTRGAAETCLLTEHLINNETPLIITNCDQLFNWDTTEFLQFAENNNADGLVATFSSNDNKYSYIKVDENGIGLELAEKEPISDKALTGFHYWKHGKDFVDSAKTMIDNNETYKNEFYVAPTMNKMIKQGKKILAYHTKPEETIIIGTPTELENYLQFYDHNKT